MSLATAIKLGDPTQLPSRRDEDWRWTDLRGLIRQIPPSAEWAEVGEGGPFAAIEAEEFVVSNGHIEGWNAVVSEGPADIARLRVVATEASSNPATVFVTVRAGTSLLLLETYEALADGALTNVALEVEVQAGGRLERVVLAADGPDSVTVSTAKVALGEGAIFAQTVLTSGARRQRLETQVAHPGAFASVRMDGAYLLADKRHADITTVVTHQGVDGTTEQLVKGVVNDQARGVFQGRIVVAHGADRTDARMGHHALILSDKAEVDAKPELLINADDVACAHGNTVGALDEEAIFYARQRGIPEAEARAMLTLAFVEEVIDRIGHDGAREIARAWAHRQLGASDGL
ncbi:Fe-S cluster assembly protein SufD [Caulobacter ginsengisoli]|uniref:Fe-S cluster assembly protein SufD n=1 Tax=Caulobacter ginsengisoli TaxID=400775 RepID=A0ABU0ILR1_9CAUL|nr:Fe-S cluster assembly protein SufD [Caulobacter ginsengisoli]MDQ0462904.1 Fe-S cluster assembly protein SufD [Caulobacter ginsengisoli]